MTDILDDLRRDLAYAQSVKTLHAVVRVNVGEAVIAEVERLRWQLKTALVHNRNLFGRVLDQLKTRTTVADCYQFVQQFRDEETK